MPTPLVDGILTQPYVSVAEFRASPTWIDSDDLVQGGTQSEQDAELTNQLLKASDWAIGHCDQPLHAHLVTQTERVRPDRYGRVYMHPSNNPVRQVTAMAYGYDPSLLQPMTFTTGTVWVEDSRGLVVSLIPGTANLTSLEFGPAFWPGDYVFVQYQYVAGFANTTLASQANSGASSLAVKDPTGFQAPTTVNGLSIPGSTARIWDAGVEEAVTVSSISSNTLTLNGTLANTHAAGVIVSEFPPAVRQAIISYAVGLLCRDDESASEPNSQTRYGPSARRSKSKGKAGGLIEEAERLLRPYRRIR